LEEITLTINGQHISCRSGISILVAAKENGIKIPTLCSHPHLEPAGACRVCIVEEGNSGRILASCVTPASSGMAIQTDSPTVKRHRTNIVRLMMANHPESCIVCNQGNRCELRQLAAELGVGSTGFYPMPHYRRLEEGNPFIIRDLSKCILCGKCIRADHELVVVGAIDYNLRGFKSRPATAHDLPLETSSCTFCGTCVSICPTGALMTKNTRYVGSPQKETRTICGFCGVGCSLLMGSVDDKVVEANPSHEEGTVNRSTLCVRGHFANDFLNASQRLTTPLVRKNGELEPATWEEALDLVTETLNSIREKEGPQSLGFLGSSKCSNEENYLFQKMARVIVRTNNVDNGSCPLGHSVLRALNKTLEGAPPVAPLAELEGAEVIFVLGADPVHSAPVLAYYLKRASSIKGVPMIVVDPRRTDLVPFSSIWLPVVPHTDSQVINAIASILIKKKAYDAHFINRFTEGFDAYCDGLASVDLQKASRISGLDLELLEKTADLLKGKAINFVVGQGILQQRYGLQATAALLNLALMTGSLGVQGKGFYFLAARNNQIGARDMGTVPDLLPGRRMISREGNLKYWEQTWRVKLSPDPGLNMIRMIEEAEKGNLRVLYIMGENPLRGLPEPQRIRRALENLEFLVVQDILCNESTELADVVLPGAAFSEKGGSFTNMEGRIQSFGPVVPPPGEAKPDWEILNRLYGKMGRAEQYSGLEGIRAEISRVVPMYSGLRESCPESWVGEQGRERPFLVEGEETPIPFAPLLRVKEQEGGEDYPFKAILGSSRFHLGSGTRTTRSDRIRGFGLKGEVEMSSEDASELDLKDGDEVRISSPHGSITREVALRKDLSAGLIFVPRAFHENEAMRLVGLTQLGLEDSPGWKEVGVRIEKV